MDSVSVILVESNRNFLRLLLHFLEEHASTTVHVVAATVGPAAAIVATAAQRPQVAILGINGSWFDCDLIMALRAVHADLSIIAIAQLDVEEYRSAALAAGANHFLSKDTLHRDLIRVIAECVDEVKGA